MFYPAFYEYGRDLDDGIYFRPSHRNVCAPHFHRQIEFLYIVGGSYLVAHNGLERKLGKGDVFFADSYDAHAYTPETPDTLSTVLLIPYKNQRDFIQCKKRKSFQTNYITDPEKTARYPELLEMFSQHQDGHPLYLAGIFNAVLGLILEQVPLSDTVEARNTEFARRVMAYLEDCLTEEITLHSAASKFGYSDNHFSRLFHDCFNSNFNAYVNSLRVQYAHQLISDGKPILDAAFDAGFSSLSTFYRSFLKQYGSTPSETFKGLL